VPLANHDAFDVVADQACDVLDGCRIHLPPLLLARLPAPDLTIGRR
jgi:hypothetical protein